MPVRKYPPIERVRQALRYQEDGRLFWRNRPVDHFPDTRSWRTWNTRYADTEAGGIFECPTGGPRWKLGLDGRDYFRHKVVWALNNGEWIGELDHINRNRLDDRIENLRPATSSQNAANSSLRRDSVSGFKGVSWFAKGNKNWRAQIRVNGRVFHLGLFADPVEAHAAYLVAAREHFGEFYCDGKSESTADDVPIDPSSEHLGRPIQRTFWE